MSKSIMDNKLRIFIQSHSMNKIYEKQAFDYFTKVVTCYIKCVANRLMRIAIHSKRVTVYKKDLELFYIVTRSDCSAGFLRDIQLSSDYKLSKSVIRYYTSRIIKRYNAEIYIMFSLIIADFVGQLIVRIKSKTVKLSQLKQLLKSYHLFNLMSKNCD